MLEILRATRTADYDDVAESLSAHPVVRVHDGTYLRALEIQHQLAIRSQHRGIAASPRPTCWSPPRPRKSTRPSFTTTETSTWSPE